MVFGYFYWKCCFETSHEWIHSDSARSLRGGILGWRSYEVGWEMMDVAASLVGVLLLGRSMIYDLSVLLRLNLLQGIILVFARLVLAESMYTLLTVSWFVPEASFFSLPLSDQSRVSFLGSPKDLKYMAKWLSYLSGSSFWLWGQEEKP